MEHPLPLPRARAISESGEAAYFETWAAFHAASEVVLKWLDSHLAGARVFVSWQQYYARRADEADDSHQDNIAAREALAIARYVLAERAEKYLSFQIYSSPLSEFWSKEGEGGQKWRFYWSGIEIGIEAQPIDLEWAQEAALRDGFVIEDTFPSHLGGSIETWVSASYFMEDYDDDDPFADK